MRQTDKRRHLNYTSETESGRGPRGTGTPGLQVREHQQEGQLSSELEREETDTGQTERRLPQNGRDRAHWERLLKQSQETAGDTGDSTTQHIPHVYGLCGFPREGCGNSVPATWQHRGAVLMLFLGNRPGFSLAYLLLPLQDPQQRVESGGFLPKRHREATLL